MGPGQLVGLGFTVDFLSHVGLIIKILFLIKRFCLYAIIIIFQILGLAFFFAFNLVFSFVSPDDSIC